MSGDLRGRNALVIPNDAITPFTLAVPQADLEDLNRRIDQTRCPDADPRKLFACRSVGPPADGVHRRDDDPAAWAGGIRC
jgi:hypothetical protein